jgi:hypothetical protein
MSDNLGKLGGCMLNQSEPAAGAIFWSLFCSESFGHIQIVAHPEENHIQVRLDRTVACPQAVHEELEVWWALA